MFRIYFPDQGSNPGPLHWEHGVSATGPQGSSLRASKCSSHVSPVYSSQSTYLFPPKLSCVRVGWHIRNLYKHLRSSLPSKIWRAISSIFWEEVPEGRFLASETCVWVTPCRTRLFPSPICGSFFSSVFGRGSLPRWVQFSSVTQLCLIICDPMDCSTPASRTITKSQSLLKLMSIKSVMPSNHNHTIHPLLSLSPPTFNLSQHQGLFKLVSSSNQVAKVLEFQLQHQSFQWRVDFS